MAESTAFPAPRPGVNALNAAAPLCSAARQSKFGHSSIADSRPVWPRMMVLFAALVALKLVLIGGQGQNLYESHWRIGGLRVSSLNYIAFYAFVILGGMSLVRLGKESRGVGMGCLRAVNAAVLVLGLSFVFLTFHNGDKNFLYPILDGVLKWSSLGPYVANALCFNEPFLAAWVFVYAASYYLLARTGRESWMLSLTAAFGCGYALVYLEDLFVHRDELLIIDCLGLISLFMAWRSGRRHEKEEALGASSRPPSVGCYSLPGPSLVWLVWPLAWIVFFGWALLRFDTQWHSHAAAYFLGLVGLTFTLVSAATLLIRKLGNPAAWNCLLPFFFVAFLLLANTKYPSSGNYDHLLCLALTFPRYFVGELALVAVLGLAGSIYRRIRPGAGFWWLDLASLILIIVAGFDLRLSQIMGVRLGWDLLAFGDSPRMMLRMAKPYLPGVLAGLVLVILGYALALRTIGIWSARVGLTGADVRRPTLINFRGSRVFTSSTVFLAAVFVFLGLLGLAIADSDTAEGQAGLRLVKTSPFWKRVASRTLSREEFVSSATSLGLGDFASARSSVPLQPRRDLNVLVVFMESSYNKHLSLFGSTEETQPLLSKYKDRMELFPNFFSAFAGSIHARFATFTSLYPVLDFHAFTQDRVPVKSLFEVLHDQGYACSMFYSSYFDYTGFRGFLKNRGLDEMYDADTMPGLRGSERLEWGLLEEETLSAMRNRLKRYAQEHQRFCLTYVPAAPHYPYDKIPKRFQKYKMAEVGDFTPLYLNDLLYIDWVLASIVDQLKESGLLESTLVVITNDHGEMLGGKDGHIGHGWAITPELANTPLIVMDPQRPGFQLNKTIGTQVDLLPTILDRLRIPVPPDQLYEGRSLDAGADRAGRLAYLNSNKEFGIISGDQIVLGDRENNNPTGVASKGSAYTITNEGPKTLFSESGPPAPIPDRKETMARFDAFQENLLRNYSLYCSLLRGAAPKVANAAQSR